MTNLTAYINENRNYLGDSLIVLEQLTEAQFDVLQAVTRETGNADVGNLATLKIPRLSSKVLEVLQCNPCLCYAHRNLMLTDLKHTPEVEQTIFGSEGISYLNNILASLDEPGCPDKEAFREYCYENGKVSIVDKLDFWLQPFSKQEKQVTSEFKA